MVSTEEATLHVSAGLGIMAGEAIIHRWNAAMGVLSITYQAEQTVMEKVWLEENDDWCKALLICDCKSIVHAVGNSHEGIRVVQATALRLNAERRLKVLWVLTSSAL